MWKRMMQRTQIPRKRKITNRAPAPPLAKKRGKGQGQQRKQRKLQHRVQNQSISTSAQHHLLDDKGQEGVKTTAASSSSSFFLHQRNSAVSSNVFHSTSDSTLIEQEEEFQAAEEEAFHSRTRKKNINLKSSREAVQVQVLPRKGPLLEAKFVSNSENSCLEAAVATTSVQFSCSCRNSTGRGEGEKHNSLVVYSEARISTSVSPNQPKTWKPDFGQSFVYSEELSCADSVFDAEIQTALSKLDHNEYDEEQAAASSCIAADVTPSFFLASFESEETSTDQFLTVVSDDLQADSGAVRPSVIASSCYPLIGEFEEKFWSWSDYVSAKGSPGLTELPLTITDLECGECTESRRGNEVFSDYLQDYICTEDEDEDTFQKFKARERKKPPFQGHLLDSINTQLTDAIGKQRLLMVNWIMEYTASYQLQWETLFLSTNLLDRFLAKGAFTNDRHIQALGIACMTLAIRIEENQPTNCIRQETFTVEDNVFKRQEVVAMEWIVLKVLDYRCSSPTTATFLWYYLKAARGDAEVEKTAKYLACLSLVDRQLLRFWPSTIAASLVVLTCQVLNNTQVSCLSMMQEKLGNDDDEDMAECVQMLKWLLENVW